MKSDTEGDGVACRQTLSSGSRGLALGLADGGHGDIKGNCKAHADDTRKRKYLLTFRS